jgi:hypothetical protein
MLERRLHVRRSWVRSEMTTPKSRASRRTVHFGLKTSAALDEQFKASQYRGDEDLVFGRLGGRKRVKRPEGRFTLEGVPVQPRGWKYWV